MQPSLKHLILAVHIPYGRVLERLTETCPQTVLRLYLKEEAANDNTSPTDLIKLRRFFSQFAEIRWVTYGPNADFVLSSAHGGLQSTQLSGGLLEPRVGQFISSCSSALTVVDFNHIFIIGTFLPMVGGTLEYLKLQPGIDPRRKVNAINARRCPKLAHLALSTDEEDLLSSAPDFLNVIHELGPQLRTIRFMFGAPDNNWDCLDADLMTVTAANCPNMEAFILVRDGESDEYEDEDGKTFAERRRKMKLFYYEDGYVISAWERGVDGQVCLPREPHWESMLEYLDRVLDSFTMNIG
ncbi:hypothetical protein HK102_004421 [Quaeritorhiza haematococci]|nr:hypothetical protein HK102_004421 [Quaeritorhiza haematococci]